MTEGNDPVSRFYLKHLGGQWQETITADCPFCRDHGYESGRLVVFLNKNSFFHGYFRCLNRCVPGGYPLWFARLAALPLSEVPGFDPDQDIVALQPEYPVENINDEMAACRDRITESVYGLFKESGIGRAVLTEMRIGFNGRYLVFPYYQEDGNCYSARCIHPGRAEDFFWHGNLDFSREPFNLYNVQDVQKCENGALFICEGEENLLTLKQLGFPGVAVAHYNILEKLPARLFDKITTLFIVIANTVESENAARNLAYRVGYKARILSWLPNAPRGYTLRKLAKDAGKTFAGKIGEMVRRSRAFSPFSSPQREYQQFLQTLAKEQGEEYGNLSSGFQLLDAAIGGIHGLNVIGGAPKVGKSTFMIQIASQMALRKIPVLYYDFENGRQKIYQRTLSRIARLSSDRLSAHTLPAEEKQRAEEARKGLEKMLFFWRVINDRKVTPELMRKHVDFIRHETRSEYTVVVIDSLHKLPFNEFTERRTGIDAWLRQMESIRDDLQVSFLVISELTRGTTGSYREEPHLGIFKGSGDIEYSADNAMVLYPTSPDSGRELAGASPTSTLWLVASREHSPGRVADYRLDYPYWGFTESPAADKE
ncbi:MAG: DNA helicase [Desulfobulbaceae bacterium BRH_c16a]|nr:MAG: DNA helicase [Desulfobulbaceae bacterium BRH_c16a]